MSGNRTRERQILAKRLGLDQDAGDQNPVWVRVLGLDRGFEKRVRVGVRVTYLVLHISRHHDFVKLPPDKQKLDRSTSIVLSRSLFLSPFLYAMILFTGVKV